jgi:hypothetical protein
LQEKIKDQEKQTKQNVKKKKCLMVLKLSRKSALHRSRQKHRLLCWPGQGQAELSWDILGVRTTSILSAPFNLSLTFISS